MIAIREKIIFVFGILMSLIYLAIGISLFTLDNFLVSYDKVIKIGIGCIFVAYSFFRLYRSIKNWNVKDESES